ncbi:MAG: VWA domain-containing protein [Blastocatellia bacterium]
MSSKSIRSLLAVALIAISVVSLLPPAYALGGLQSGTEARPRRGKNDSASSPSKDRAQTDASQQDDSGQSQMEGQKPGKPAGTKQGSYADESQSRDADRLSQTDVSESKERRVVPAFDRPPLRSDSHTQGSQQPARRAPQISTPDDRTSAGTSRDNRSQPSASRTPGANSPDGSGGAIDDADAERSRRQRPVLRRSSDPADEAGRRPPQSAPSQPRAGSNQSDQSQRQPAEDEAIRLESTLVNLPLLVSDRSGRFIPQLTKNDFLLYEDGVQQQVASFGNEEVPFSVALLLDVSPSVQGNIPDIQEAALAFVRQLRAHDRVMVVSFDRRAQYLTDFTSDRRRLESAIRSISTGSGTSVYDAVYETVAQRLRGVEGRKALILFSDGEDTTSSHASYDEAVNVVTEADVLVYGLRYPGNGGGNIRINPWPRFPNPQTQIPFPFPFPWPFPQPRRRRGPFTADPNADPSGSNAGPQSRRGRRGSDFMADIAAAGGGPVYDAEHIGDMTRLATRIADELRHVYVISYYPTNPLSNGGYRAIRVSVKGRDEIAVRHRKGYNARDARSGRPTI